MQPRPRTSLLLKLGVFLLLGAFVNVAVALGSAYWSRPTVTRDYRLCAPAGWHFKPPIQFCDSATLGTRNTTALYSTESQAAMVRHPDDVQALRDWTVQNADAVCAQEDQSSKWAIPTLSVGMNMKEYFALAAAKSPGLRAQRGHLLRVLYELEMTQPGLSEGWCWQDILCTGWPLRSMAGARLESFSFLSELSYQTTHTRSVVPKHARQSMGVFADSPLDLIPLSPMPLGFAINSILYAAFFGLLFCGPSKLRRLIRIRQGRCPACAYPIGISPVCTECGQFLPQRPAATTP